MKGITIEMNKKLAIYTLSKMLFIYIAATFKNPAFQVIFNTFSSIKS